MKLLTRFFIEEKEKKSCGGLEVELFKIFVSPIIVIKKELRRMEKSQKREKC